MQNTDSVRQRVRERMRRERIPVGTDDPMLLTLGAQPLSLERPCSTCCGYGYLGHTNPVFGDECPDCGGRGAQNDGI